MIQDLKAVADCQHCGHDHPAYSPCVYPAAWEACHGIDGVVEEAATFPPAPPGYEAVIDDDGNDTGYRRDLSTGLVVTLDDGDEDDE